MTCVGAFLRSVANCVSLTDRQGTCILMADTLLIPATPKGQLAEPKSVETTSSQGSNTGSQSSKRGDCIMKNSAFPPELLQKSYQTVCGELAWRVSDVPCLLEHAARENLVILGGDVVTLQGVYTYDNWYYEVSNLQSVKTAVHGSIATARKYVHDYVQKNGNEFLFVLVMQKLLGVVDGNIYWDHD